MKEFTIKVDEATRCRLDERLGENMTYDQCLAELLEAWERKVNFDYKRYNIFMSLFFVVGIVIAASISAIIAYFGTGYGFNLWKTIVISTIFASIVSTPFFYKFGSLKFRVDKAV